jgi:ubiquinone/menaquinone biosynthesis C-methylase UbiE
MIAQKDFSTVSEAPGIRVTRENADMLYTRYAFARRISADKDVLEVACGAGMGLRLVAEAARSIVAGDIDPSFVAAARNHYGNRVPIVELTADRLPFPDASMDVVLLLEAIYFLPDAGAFFQEARRVLRPGGSILVVSANREWTCFNPCEGSNRYYSAAELRKCLEQIGMAVETFKGFADRPDGIKSRILAAARRFVTGLHLIPQTMKGKELLKRLAYGKLIVLPDEIGVGFSAEETLEPHKSDEPVVDYKVIYALGRLH